MKRYIKAAVVHLTDEDPAIIRSIARNSEDVEVLRDIFDNFGNPKDYEYFYCLDLANNENTPQDILTKLADFRYDSRIRASVAENPNTPIATLYDLTKYSYEDILRGIARNTNAPPELLSKISDVSAHNYWPCVYVAYNYNTAMEDLIKLSTHWQADVRYAIVKNPNTPMAVIVNMINDPNMDVRNAVLERLGPNAEEKANLINQFNDRILGDN